jgi:predicted ATP-dependent serine protease
MKMNNVYVCASCGTVEDEDDFIGECKNCGDTEVFTIEQYRDFYYAWRKLQEDYDNLIVVLDGEDY